MQSARFSAVAAVLLIAVSVTPLRADGLIRDGIGAISIGRGGTNLGFADNGTIILDNPAAMTNIAGDHLYDFGADGVITDLHYEDPGNNIDGEFSIFPSGNIGLVRRRPNSPLSVGIGMFAPAGFGARYYMDNPHLGRSLYKSIGALAKILPAAAWQVNDRLSIGGTFGVAISHVELEGPFYTQTGAMKGMPSLLDLQSTGAAIAWSAGLQYHLTPSTTIGLAYSEENRFDFNGDARTTMITPFGPMSSEFDAKTRLVWPRSIGLGIKHELCECRRLGFDFYWYNWSDAFESLPIELSNATNPAVTALAGSDITDQFPMNWKDTYSFRFGYEWESTPGRVWRTGYVYHRSPVPDGTLNPYLDGVLEHAVSVGYSRPTKYGIVNLAYQFTWGPTREVDNSQLAGNDFSDSEFTAAAHWLSISLLR